MIKQIPMLFNAPMVRATLKGRKTQTRRLKFTGKVGDVIWVRETWRYHDWSDDGEPWIHYRADDAKIFHAGIGEDSAGAPLDKWEELSAPENYDIDNRAADRKWRSAIHMPRWASRIQLRVTAVRSESLQNISESDAIAEGARRFDDIPDDSIWGKGPRWSMESPPSTDHCMHSARYAFGNFWQKIHGEGSWDENPTVQVIEFERVTI